MCLTCGCMQAHLEMGKANITYEDVKRAADANDRNRSRDPRHHHANRRHRPRRPPRRVPADQGRVGAVRVRPRHGRAYHGRVTSDFIEVARRPAPRRRRGRRSGRSSSCTRESRIFARGT